MKDYLSNVLRSFACALCAAVLGALSIALMLALYDIPRTVDMAVGLWAGVLFLLALVCELLSRRDLSMLAYVFVVAVILFFGGEQIVAHTAFIPSSSGFPVLLRMLIWISGAVCAYVCREEPCSNVFVRLSDVLILSIGAYMTVLYALNEAMILPILAFALGALLLSMLITAALRAGGESDSVIRGTGMGGYLVIGALLLVCLLLAALLLSVSSGHVDGVVELFLSVWRFLTGVLTRAFTAIALFLARLFGPPRMLERLQVEQQDSLAYSRSGMEAMETAPQWLVYLVMGVIAAVILGAILAILFALRSTKLSRKRSKKARRKVTRTSHVGAAIRALIAKVISLITFELRYRANRHTPQGLYVFAVRACLTKRIPRKKHESPGAYLRRLHALLAAQGSVSQLDQLAEMLDGALYGGMQPQLDRSRADAFARQIRAIAPPPILKTNKSE
ncbi:MAG: hypothetical protein IJ313_02775 [Clostridia bacterium]|nr:hypothetical protein [Clostridia bacterium]